MRLESAAGPVARGEIRSRTPMAQARAAHAELYADSPRTCNGDRLRDAGPFGAFGS